MSREERLVVAVIPAYNEEATIGGVISETRKYVEKIVVCDDGSTDETGKIAERLGATVVRHARRSGYGAALSTLFKEARKLKPDAIVTLDADGQHNPVYIPKLVGPILGNGADIVIGSRFLSKDGLERLPSYRKIGIRLITRLAREASYNGITDAQSGFRAYNRKALHSIQLTGQGMGVSTEILIKAKQASLIVKETPVVIGYEGETSKQNPIVHAFEVVTSTIKTMSMRRPLIFFGVPGMAALSMAFGFWIWGLTIFGTTGKILTYVTCTALVATMAGLILAMTAIVLWESTDTIAEKSSARTHSY